MITKDMKVLVAAKQVIDYKVKIRVAADSSGVITDGVKLSMNPFDEIALEEAIRLKEKNIVTEIILVSIGPVSAQEILRQGLALGADRAILIQTDKILEPLNIAKILQKIVLMEEACLVLLGKQAIDDDCNQTGQMLAGLLNWPQATFASKILIDKKIAEVTREVDLGLEKIRVHLPAVITSDLRLNHPRYPTLPNIMKAKQKPLQIINLAESGVDISPHHQVQQVTSPPQRTAGIQVESLQVLMKTLEDKGLL